MLSISAHFRPRQWVETFNASKVIHYSSPWPWVLAIVLSVALWALLGWFLWRLIN